MNKAQYPIRLNKEMFKGCDVTHSEIHTHKDARWDLNDGEELASISTPDGNVANVTHLYTGRQGKYDSFSVEAAAKWKCSCAIEFGENNNVNLKQSSSSFEKTKFIETCWQLQRLDPGFFPWIYFSLSQQKNIIVGSLSVRLGACKHSYL